MPGRGRLVVVALVLAAVVGTTGLAWVLLARPDIASGRTGEVGPPATPAPTPADARFGEEQAEQLVDDLASGERQRVERAFVMNDHSELRPDFVEELRSLRFEIDIRTFTAGDLPGSGSVRATMPGTDESWTLVLHHGEGRWRIADTVPVEEQP